MLACWSAIRGVNTYASNELLQLRGKSNLIAEVPETCKSLNVEFYITLDKATTLPGGDTSELLSVLRVGVPISSCELKHKPRETQQSERTEKLRSRQNSQRCLTVCGS